MHPYCKHLLQDIAQAHYTDIRPPGVEPTAFIEETELAERWKQCSREKTFGECCGLQAGNFPPPGQFTTAEIEMINHAFLQMMATYRLDPCMPEKLPAKTAYTILVNTLNEKMFTKAAGTARFDYCTGYPPDCIFGEYCRCLTLWNSLPETDADMFPAGSNPA